MDNGQEHRYNTDGLQPPWPKGVSGNPGGRPKGRSITAQLRKLIDEGLDGQDIAQALAKTGIKHALKGDHRFWQSVLDRTDGKTPDIAQHDGTIKVIVEYASKPDERSEGDTTDAAHGPAPSDG